MWGKNHKQCHPRQRHYITEQTHQHSMDLKLSSPWLHCCFEKAHAPDSLSPPSEPCWTLPPAPFPPPSAHHLLKGARVFPLRLVLLLPLPLGDHFSVDPSFGDCSLPQSQVLRGNEKSSYSQTAHSQVQNTLKMCYLPKRLKIHARVTQSVLCTVRRNHITFKLQWTRTYKPKLACYVSGKPVSETLNAANVTVFLLVLSFSAVIAFI